jgi:hypothetical protein
LDKRYIFSHKAVLSAVMVLMIISSIPFSGIAYGQQQYAAGGQRQAPAAGATSDSPVIQGLEGLKGFGSGHSQLSLAVIPVSQKDNIMMFQVIGFAVSIPESGEAVVYSMKTPLPGVIDPSQNTLQIDITDIATAVETAGYTDSSQIYDTIRSDPQVVVIDVDLNYQGKQDSQTSFNVNSIDIIPPDGKMQAFSMKQPTRLIIDTQDNRVSMVAFPEMASTFGSYYGTTYTQLEPVIYTQPIAIMAPIFVPYIRPIPIYRTGFVRYNSFHYGAGFHRYYDRDPVTGRDRYTNNKVYPVRQPKNDIADRSRNNLVAGQRQGQFTESRKAGSGVNGGIGGYRGGVKKTGGGKVGGGKVGGGRRR